MSQKDEARAFHYAVYDAVRLIPHGRVTSYGHIAKLIYRPRYSRHVGQALKALPREHSEEYPYSIENVPWWRVMSAAGVISTREETAMERQKRMLLDEGIPVNDNNKVDLLEYGWFPETEFDDYD